MALVATTRTWSTTCSLHRLMKPASARLNRVRSIASGLKCHRSRKRSLPAGVTSRSSCTVRSRMTLRPKQSPTGKSSTQYRSQQTWACWNLSPGADLSRMTNIHRARCTRVTTPAPRTPSRNRSRRSRYSRKLKRAIVHATHHPHRIQPRSLPASLRPHIHAQRARGRRTVALHRPYRPLYPVAGHLLRFALLTLHCSTTPTPPTPRPHAPCSLTGDWVTLHVNGIRYLEKPPLPYWLVALSFRLFGFNTFATHLPRSARCPGSSPRSAIWWAAPSLSTASNRPLHRRCDRSPSIGRLSLHPHLHPGRPAVALHLRWPSIAFHRRHWNGPAQSRRAPLTSIWSSPSHCAVLTKGLVAPRAGPADRDRLPAHLPGEASHTWRRGSDAFGPQLAHPSLPRCRCAPWHVLAGAAQHRWRARPRLRLVLLRQRARPPLPWPPPRHVDYAKLPAALYWSSAPRLAFPVEPLRSRRCSARSSVGYRACRTAPCCRACRRSRLKTVAPSLLLCGLQRPSCSSFSPSRPTRSTTPSPHTCPLLMLTTAAHHTLRSRASPQDRTLRRNSDHRFAHRHLRRPRCLRSLSLSQQALFDLKATYAKRRRHRCPPHAPRRRQRATRCRCRSFFDLTGPSFAALRLPARTSPSLTFAIGPAIACALSTTAVA